MANFNIQFNRDSYTYGNTDHINRGRNNSNITIKCATIKPISNSALRGATAHNKTLGIKLKMNKSQITYRDWEISVDRKITQHTYK